MPAARASAEDESLARTYPSRQQFFRKGELRLLILDLLTEGPRHGYEIIRAIEDRAGGVHSPSPGAVYPTLDLLSDKGYIVGTRDQGRQVYAITPAGEAFLATQATALRSIHRRLNEWWAPAARDQLGQVDIQLKAMRRAVASWRGGQGGEHALSRISEIVTRALKDIDDVLNEASPTADD